MHRYVITAALALALIALSVWQLEADRQGLSIRPLKLPDGTPAALYKRKDAGTAPVVAIAHGVAGSS